MSAISYIHIYYIPVYMYIRECAETEYQYSVIQTLSITQVLQTMQLGKDSILNQLF